MKSLRHKSQTFLFPAFAEYFNDRYLHPNF